MREIKFRAWTGERMFEPYYFELYHGSDSAMPYRCYEDWRDLEDGRGQPCEIMQYTGLKDKNGKEIYEGDIVKTGTDKNMFVGWSDRFASFVIRRDGWAFQHWFGEAFEGDQCEVIGNIYQNPELLNQ